MENSVTILDDTLRANRVQVVNGQVLLVKDSFGNQVQDIIHSEITFEGAHLDHAIKRAKRHMRSKNFKFFGGAPRHIAVMMAAFHKADPVSFKACLGANIS